MIKKAYSVERIAYRKTGNSLEIASLSARNDKWKLSAKRYPLNANIGQTVIETALVLPLFFILLFLLWEFAFLCVERDAAKYAAFVAARSYQVYGSQEGEPLGGGNKDKIYKLVGKLSLQSSFPYPFKFEDVGDTIKVTVDTAIPPEILYKEIPDYDKYIQFYGLTADDKPTDEPNDKPTFGLLKLEYNYSWFASDSKDKPYFVPQTFGVQKVMVPYRLEPWLCPHMTGSGSCTPKFDGLE